MLRNVPENLQILEFLLENGLQIPEVVVRWIVLKNNSNALDLKLLREYFKRNPNRVNSEVFINIRTEKHRIINGTHLDMAVLFGKDSEIIECLTSVGFTMMNKILYGKKHTYGKKQGLVSDLIGHQDFQTPRRWQSSPDVYYGGACVIS